MSEFTLVIGSKTYSSWSLRPWLFLRHHNVQFKEVTVPLNQPDTAKRIREHSPSGRVPVLKSGSLKVWESLAICEYAAETLKLANAWPAEAGLRAQARALACEMQASFAELRRELPLDCRRAPAAQAYSAAVAADIARIRSIWRDCRQASAKSGDWLFGKFGIVDAMYAPVALRFHSYAVVLDGPERDYMNSVLNLPALREWLGAALLENVPAAGFAAPSTVDEPAEPAEPAERTQQIRRKPAAAESSQKPLAPDELPPAWGRQANERPAPPEKPAPEKPSSKKQVISEEGGVKVTSYIIPE